jgi:hypothetical protein
VNQLNGVETEHAPRCAARGCDSTRDITCRVGQFEGLEVRAQRDALLELAKIRLFQAIRQFGLPRKYQRQEFGHPRLDICQETNFLQRLNAQPLGFVDNQGRRLSNGVALAEQDLETFEQ